MVKDVEERTVKEGVEGRKEDILLGRRHRMFD
jgi:hypothetical protein